MSDTDGLSPDREQSKGVIGRGVSPLRVASRGGNACSGRRFRYEGARMLTLVLLAENSVIAENSGIAGVVSTYTGLESSFCLIVNESG